MQQKPESRGSFFSSGRWGFFTSGICGEDVSKVTDKCHCLQAGGNQLWLQHGTASASEIVSSQQMVVRPAPAGRECLIKSMCEGTYMCAACFLFSKEMWDQASQDPT